MMMNKPLQTHRKQASLAIQKSSKLLTGRRSSFVLMDMIKYLTVTVRYV